MILKVEFEIEIEDGFWFDPDCQEETEWFMNMLNDKENTFAMLHSNEIGDSLGESDNFKYEIKYE